MRGLFSKKGLAILSSLTIGLVVIALLVVAWNREPNQMRVAKQRLHAQRYAATVTPLLTHDEAVVGEWEGVRSSGTLGYSRSFSKSGRMFVCYGDVIYDGSYRLIDKATLETCNRFDGGINRWTFGFLEGELVLINRSASRVEEYKRVASGTLQGPVLE